MYITLSQSTRMALEGVHAANSNVRNAINVDVCVAVELAELGRYPIAKE